MPGHRCILARLFLSTIACVLIIGIACSEIPECLTLVNNTSNDFTIRKAGSIEGIHLSRTAIQVPIRVAVKSMEYTATDLWTAAGEDAPPICCRLFILHSVLRT
jgi:hypothetical protein